MNPLIWLIWSSYLCALVAAQYHQDPVVYTSQLGYVEGFLYKTENDFDVNVFLGIPYALPPVGELRFEKPQRIANQSKTPINAKKFAASCYPHHRDALIPRTLIPDAEHSEDSLYLNVLAPATKSFTGYPVLVFIHGGGFEFGGSVQHGYKAVSEHFVSRGIVFVSINYRVGALGFLTDGSKRLPGNLGLWDQTLALQFINDNIVAWNGDPNQVTIMGHSAGSMSVSALTLSPHSNTLFQRAISLSGAAFCGAAFTEQTVRDGKELIAAVGCSMENTDEMMKCLKERSVDELLDAVDRTGTSRQSVFVLKLHPRIDGDFVVESVDEMLSKAPQIPSILGAADMEAALPLITKNSQFLWNLTIPETQFVTFSETDFLHYVNNVVANEVDYGDNAGQLRALLVKFYLRDDDNGDNREDDNNRSSHVKDANFYIQRLVEMITDMLFNIPLYLEAKEKMLHGWPVYLFEQEYANEELHKNRPVKGAYHTNEFPYIFGFSVLENFEFTDEDRSFQDLWVETIINFVKTGSPSSDKYHWDMLTKTYSSRYYSFTPKPSMKPFYRKESVHFWTEEVPKEILDKLLVFKLERTSEIKQHGEL